MVFVDAESPQVGHELRVARRPAYARMLPERVERDVLDSSSPYFFILHVQMLNGIQVGELRKMKSGPFFEVRLIIYPEQRRTMCETLGCFPGVTPEQNS